MWERKRGGLSLTLSLSRTRSLSLSLSLSLLPPQVYQNYGAPESWKSMVPPHGVLSFDFVSGVLPPEDAVAISDAQLMEFLSHGVGIGVDPETGGFEFVSGVAVDVVKDICIHARA
jgi:hypothetical protein